MVGLTRFEVTRVISARALQLALGAPALVKHHKADSVNDVARAEYEKKLIPLSVIREFPGGKVERVEVN